jgi:hypothetical protein
MNLHKCDISPTYWTLQDPNGNPELRFQVLFPARRLIPMIYDGHLASSVVCSPRVYSFF